MAGGDEAANPVFRVGGVSYLRIPAPDPARSAAFYAAVFGWTVDTSRDVPNFSDGTGHVIGHFVSDISVAGSSGVRPYIFVSSVDDVLGRAVSCGGSVATEPYPEGDLRVATLFDPAGNEIGVWQTT
jgi:predicted enzyme related to lactoylglutathione lyase